jgi:hypothetical protein
VQGDSFNFLGCLLTGDQLATQNLSASYFMFADFMIISQVSASAKTDVLFFLLHSVLALACWYFLSSLLPSSCRSRFSQSLKSSFFCVLLHAPIEKLQNVSNP